MSSPDLRCRTVTDSFSSPAHIDKRGSSTDFSEEKPTVATINDSKKNSYGNAGPSAAGTNVDFSGIDEKKVLRKMDIRLIPMLALLYLLSFLDRKPLLCSPCPKLRQMD
jgi:hypothetical protein